MIPDLTFVTGANRNYFPILCAFLESFSDFCKGERLYVCDFGLSAEQRSFVDRLGLLRARPADIPGGLQSFYYKASIGNYLANDPVSRVVWIDCDCLILESVGQHLRALSERLEPYGDYLAVSSDQSGSIGEFIRRHGDDPDGTAPFGKLMNELALPLGLEYLNSAVFLLSSPRFLRDWHRLSFETPFHVLFEQNLFNVLAYQGFARLHLLDADIWNAHDLKLNRMHVAQGDGRAPFRVVLDNKRVLVAHATSFMQQSIEVKDISIEIEGMKLNGYFKFIRNPQVRNLQMNYMLRFIKNHSDLLRDCGVLEPARNPGRVIADLEKSLAREPDSIDSVLHLAAACFENGRLDRAISLYRSLLRIKPDHIEGLVNLGNSLCRQNKHSEARECYQRAIQRKPDCAEAYYNMGVAIMGQNEPESAISWYRKAVEVNPAYLDALYNMGLAWKTLQKFDEALASFDRLLKLMPDHANAHLQKAFTLLMSGRYEEGWEEYEWRTKIEPAQFEPLQPRWDGSVLGGKTIFVDSEQGLGDVLQFIRYLPLLKARCAKVIFACDKELTRLLKGFPGIDLLVTKRNGVFQSSRFDASIPLLSLPRIFQTTIHTIPSTFPYIRPDPALVERWRERINPVKFNVGLVWGSGPRYPERDCPLEQFQSLTSVPGVELYSLQKGGHAQALQALQERLPAIDLGRDIRDLAETAAVISLLDLVLSVDTSVAHLAGAMAQEVWTLLPYSACWRYSMEPESTPWYPSMRLFRQRRAGQWGPVISEVTTRLGVLAGEKRTQMADQGALQPPCGRVLSA